LRKTKRELAEELEMWTEKLEKERGRDYSEKSERKNLKIRFMRTGMQFIKFTKENEEKGKERKR
jgi:hypothetical protein